MVTELSPNRQSDLENIEARKWSEERGGARVFVPHDLLARSQLESSWLSGSQSERLDSHSWVVSVRFFSRSSSLFRRPVGHPGISSFSRSDVPLRTFLHDFVLRRSILRLRNNLGREHRNALVCQCDDHIEAIPLTLRPGEQRLLEIMLLHLIGHLSQLFGRLLQRLGRTGYYVDTLHFIFYWHANSSSKKLNHPLKASDVLTFCHPYRQFSLFRQKKIPKRY